MTPNAYGKFVNRSGRTRLPNRRLDHNCDDIALIPGSVMNAVVTPIKTSGVDWKSVIVGATAASAIFGLSSAFGSMSRDEQRFRHCFQRIRRSVHRRLDASELEQGPLGVG